MYNIFRGFVPTKNKVAQMKFKDKDVLPYDKVKDLEEFAEQIENGLVNLQGIQGLKQVLKSRKQQTDAR